jgi:hypothetical protein
VLLASFSHPAARRYRVAAFDLSAAHRRPGPPRRPSPPAAVNAGKSYGPVGRGKTVRGTSAGLELAATIGRSPHE